MKFKFGQDVVIIDEDSAFSQKHGKILKYTNTAHVLVRFFINDDYGCVDQDFLVGNVKPVK